MARLVTAGAEIRENSTVDIGCPDGYSAGAAATVTDLVTSRFGGLASYSCPGTSGSTSYRTFPFTAPASGATVYARAYVRVDALPSAVVKVAALLTAADGALISARLNTTGQLELWNDAASAQVGSDSALTVELGVWYRIQLRLKIAAGAADEAEMLVKADGAPADESVAATGLTVSDTHAARLRAGWVDAPGLTATLNLDDVAVNDSTGTKQLSWPGDGSVLYAPLLGDAIVNSWTDCSGAASIKNGVNKQPPVGIADHTNAAHTGAACHQARCAVNTAQSSNGYPMHPASAGMSADLLIGTQTTDSGTTLGSVVGAQAIAQKITFGQPTTIIALGLRLLRNNSPTDSLLVELRRDNAGAPSDVVVAAGAPLFPSSLATILGTFRFTLTAPFTTELGQSYWVVVRRSGAQDGTNNYSVGTNSVSYVDGPEAELQTSGSWTLSTTKNVRLAVYTPNGSLPVTVGFGAIAHGEAVTGVKAGSFTGGVAPGGATVNFNFGDNVGVAGTYPTNWRWAVTAPQYDKGLLTVNSTIGPTKNSGSGTNAVMVCAMGNVYEYQPPVGSWKRVQKVADSTFWWAKRSAGQLTAEVAGGATVDAESGDWLIYPEPQITEGADLPATTTTVTDDTLNAGYIDA